MREEFAKSMLRLLGIEVEPVGKGTLSEEVFEGFHESEEDRFDFKCEELGIIFEVTGTSWTRRRSAERFDPDWEEEGRRKPSPRKAVLAVLKRKVDDAFALGVEDKVYFVSVNDGQGEWRFLPCSLARKYPYGSFAHREGDYYKIPWEKWRTPEWMRRKIEELREDKRRRAGLSG
ncbi:MAG: nuclease [Candidatus Methanomethylicaceae archaeon]